MRSPSGAGRVLVVDDEPSFAGFVTEALGGLGYEVVAAHRPSDALARLAEGAFDVAILDLNLPDMSGMELARRIKEESPETQIVLLTGHADVESAIEGIHEGVFDYLEKGSLKITRLERSVREATERRRLALENRALLIQLAESNRLLTTLNTMTTALAGERYLDRVLSRVVESARSLLGAELARILLFRPTSAGELYVEAGAGEDTDTLLGARLNPFEGIAAAVALRNEAVLLEVASAHPAYSRRVDRLATDLPGFVCAPVRHDTLLGSLTVAGRPDLRPEHRDLLAGLARQAAVAIQNSLHHDRALNFFTHTSALLVSFLEKLEPANMGHSAGSAALADMLTRRLGLGDPERRSIHFGALLHDIGKIRLPSELLASQNPLSEGQRAELRRHPSLGLEMLKPITLWQDILPIVHAHHERWDGTGYPLGLAGDEVTLGARVVAIAEAFDAMTRPAPHAAARGAAAALAELEAYAGSQFDPQLVRLFLAEFRQRGDPREQAP